MTPAEQSAKITQLTELISDLHRRIIRLELWRGDMTAVKQGGWLSRWLNRQI